MANNLVTNNLVTNNLVTNNLVTNNLVTNNLVTNNLVTNNLVTNNLVTNNLVTAWLAEYDANNHDATPILGHVKTDRTTEKTRALRYFWSELAKRRLWIGGTDKKRQGWGYPEPRDVLGLLGPCQVVTIGELGANTSKRSNRVDSVLGLVRLIRGNGDHSIQIYVKAKIEDRELWSEILGEIKGKTKEVV